MITTLLGQRDHILLGLNVQLNRCKRGQRGQGIVEYAGALVIAALIIGGLITGASGNGWLAQSYTTIYNTAGGMLINFASQIGG
ncbi:MAG: hypothetical protein KC475_07925 [Cyanobacteria bacterium HKST-UBA03]|nr:hypothetical protein [Cyanobacteria bacterium HKST-UBA03]